MSSGNFSRIINKYADAIRSGHPNLWKHLYCYMFRRFGYASTETTRIYATSSIEMFGGAMNTANSTILDETLEWEENEDELARICGLR